MPGDTTDALISLIRNSGGEYTFSKFLLTGDALRRLQGLEAEQELLKVSEDSGSVTYRYSGPTSRTCTATRTPNILIVVRDLELRRQVQAALRASGFAAFAVSDGDAALDALRTRPRPRLIILDLSLPLRDGFAFWERQRANPMFEHIPVLVIASAGTMVSRQQSEEAVAAFLKPVNSDALLAVVRRYVEPQK
jgi:CheY-like chemotaxis protein